MRSNFVASIFTLILSTVWLVSCSAREMPEVLRQDIAVTLSPESHELAGRSRLVLKPHGASRLSLALAPASSVGSVLVDDRAAPFTFIGGFISIELPDVSGENVVNLEISYRCKFDDRPPKDAISGEDPTYGVKAVISPEGVFLGPGAGWYPSPPVIPGKRSIRISAPVGIEAITAGKRISRSISGKESVSQWEEARPAGDLPLSAGRFEIGESALAGISIYTYFTPENSGLSQRYLDASARHIRFYEGLFGPYPFEKFAVVENFFPTGYGFPSYTLLGSSIIRLPFIPETSLPHEIAHSWWGNGVLVDPGQGNWSEGLVTYLADYLLQERKSPESGKEYRETVLSDYASLVTSDRDFPLSEFSSRVDPASRSIGYGKGMMVFHMIRKEIGDDIFFRGLRELSRKKLNTTASWGDLLDTFSRLSGKDLSVFKSQWLNRAGGPHISFKGVAVARTDDGWKVTGEVSQTLPVYKFPMQIELETSAGKTRKGISITRQHTPFTFTTSESPARLILDPDAELFRILSPNEIPPTINRLKGARSLVMVTASDCRADGKTINLLLESLGQGGASIISEKEASVEGIAGHDVLFCGRPEKWEIVKGLTAKGFTIGKETFDQPGDALFAVTRNPVDPERVAAIFRPLSQTAAAESLPKITHYGKYSYLAFSSGRNMLKGIEAVSSGVSDILFDARK